MTTAELKSMLENVEDEAIDLWRTTSNGSLDEKTATVLKVAAKVLQRSLDDITDNIPKIRTT